MEGNKISAIELGAFRPLKELKYLSIVGNKIGSVSDHFTGLKKLTTLILDDTGLTEISYDMFQDLQNLEVIGLQENSLISILNDTSGNLQNIQDIRLRDNSLSSIFPGTFSNLPNLHYLWLGGNNLTALNQDILLAEGATMPVSNNVWIDLYQGSFQCDSRMCWILLGEHDGWLEINSLKYGNYPDLEWDGWRDLDLGCNK